MADLGESKQALSSPSTVQKIGRALMASTTTGASVLRQQEAEAAALRQAEQKQKQGIAELQYKTYSEFRNSANYAALPDDQKAAIDERTVAAASQLGLDADTALLRTPKEEGGFTLGQGQTRFDASGNEIASVEKPVKAASSIGEIKQDLANGLITDDEAKARIRKLNHVAQQNISQPGKVVRLQDLSDVDLPEELQDVFAVQNPSGSLTVIKGKDGSGGKTTYSKVEQSDGTFAVYAQENNSPPKFVGLLEDAEGQPIRSAVQNRADTRESRTRDNQELVQERFETNQEFAERKHIADVENKGADDFRADYSELKKTEQALDKLEALLSVDDVSSLDSKAIQNTLATVFNTNVRAQSELESFKTFGDLGQRLGQSVTRFISGEFTEASLEQIRAIAENMRNNVINPSKAELSALIRRRVKSQGGDPDNVVPSSGELTPAEKKELERLRSKQ